jgi:PAS domain S-box-containing protein
LRETLRVLVVEDNQGDVDLIREALSDTGFVNFQIESVSRLSEALALLKISGIDLILLDLGLPDSKGLETFRRLLEAKPHIPVIILTGNDDQGTATLAVKEGAQDYLIKGLPWGRLLVQSALYAIERKQRESRELLVRKVLDLLNRPVSTMDTIAGILELIKNGTGFEAIGIRLKKGNDFPYYASNGFSEDFVQAESRLCVYDGEGKIVCDAQGIPLLECMCGNIIRGWTDASLTFFTANGSFWTNSTSELLASTTEEDRQSRTRNRCHDEGYESVALIPLQTGGEVIGLMQLNDRRRNRFTMEMIHFFEGLGASIGIALTRMHAVEELKQSKALLEAVVENVPLMVFLKEATDLRFVIFNKAGEELLGYDRRDLMGKNNLDLFPPEQSAHFMAKDREVLDGEIGMLDIPEEPILTAGKVQRLLHTRKVCIRSSDGATKYLLGISEDITERKQAEVASQKNRMDLIAIIDNLPFLAWMKDSEGYFLAVNEPFAHACGLQSSNDLIGKTDFDVWPKNLAEAYRADDSKVMCNRQKKAVEEPISDQGRERWFETYKAPLFDIHGNVTGTTGFSRDITDRKESEKQLHDTLDSLRRAVNTTIQVMISTIEARDPYTAGHQVKSANLARAIATEMGLSQEKIEGIRMAGSIHDIGKISIPAEILSKPTKLSELEFSLIKAHAERGFEMLKDVESPWPLAEIVYQHHERMDGSGYPRNLKGDEILMEARILAVADVVEAMASHRPYRAGLGINAALEEIEKNRGIFYDTAVADACLRLFREQGFKLAEA